MQTLFLTGANRGIGLELARQYLEEGWRVVATCRRPEEASELRALGETHPQTLEIHTLSVTDWEAIPALAGTLEGRTVDLLINNAGIRGMETYHLGEIDVDIFMEVVAVNTLGALKISEAFLPHLSRSDDPLLVMMSSDLGSISRNRHGGDYAYRASKAAMNAVMRSLAADLRGAGITVISLHPGWVRTDMGGPEAPLSVRESGEAVRRVLSRVTREDSGRFLRFDGREEGW